MRPRLTDNPIAVLRRLLKRNWPTVDVTIESEPKFLFILPPSYSGSTVLAKFLNTAHNTMILEPRAEGQWLIPGMCKKDRWEPDKYINWGSVRSVWLSKYQMVEAHVGTVNLVIEKSPPNLIRADQLRNHFNDAVFVAFNRDPYANCSSRFHRHCSPESLSVSERAKSLHVLATSWLFRARCVKMVIDDFVPVYFTYERFCEDPTGCVNLLTKICPELKDVNVYDTVEVKEYKRQGIVNQNARQIALLKGDDIQAISSALKGEERLLAFFGYEIK